MIFNFAIIFIIIHLLICVIFFFSKLIIFTACCLKDSQNFSLQSSPLYTSYLLSSPPNFHIVDIEYQQNMFSDTLVAGNFQGLFLHSSNFLILICLIFNYFSINKRWFPIRFPILIKF